MLDFDTGKYAVFIWSAYGLSAGVFAVLTVSAILHARRWKARFEALASETTSKSRADT